jgi:tRNA threonylcarbamoyladenosine biosynthesis protein TsaB
MIVAFDTCGPVIGVAATDGVRTARRVGRIARGAERLLVPWALEVVAELGGELGSLRAVAAADGPGAFTGVRVGLATASGLGVALGVPLWTCDALRPRALAAGDGEVLVALDARKSRIYAAVWRGGSEAWAPADVAPAVALAEVSPGFVATGEGALLHAAAVAERGGRVSAEADDPATERLAQLAWAGIEAGEGGDPTLVRPRYLRDADVQPPRPKE